MALSAIVLNFVLIIGSHDRRIAYLRKEAFEAKRERGRPAEERVLIEQANENDRWRRMKVYHVGVGGIVVMVSAIAYTLLPLQRQPKNPPIAK